MTRKRTNPDFLNGVPELLVLRLLSRQPMYGYELVQAIHLATRSELEFGEGCLYPILHRLEADGCLVSRRATVAGRNRVVYRVTAAGTKRLDASISTWKQVARAVSMVLEGETIVSQGMA